MGGYPAGVAWSLRRGHPVPGVSEWPSTHAWPKGAGLSSSAALECSVALALTELGGRQAGPELAPIARRAENEFVGVPSPDHGPVRRHCCAGRATRCCWTASSLEDHSQVPFDPVAADRACW